MQANQVQAKPLQAGHSDQTGGRITMQICD
jgi:hypothetical protein